MNTVARKDVFKEKKERLSRMMNLQKDSEVDFESSFEADFLSPFFFWSKHLLKEIFLGGSSKKQRESSGQGRMILRKT